MGGVVLCVYSKFLMVVQGLSAAAQVMLLRSPEFGAYMHATPPGIPVYIFKDAQGDHPPSPAHMCMKFCIHT